MNSQIAGAEKLRCVWLLVMNEVLEAALQTALTLGGRCTRLMSDGFVVVFSDEESQQQFYELAADYEGVTVSKVGTSVVVRI